MLTYRTWPFQFRSIMELSIHYTIMLASLSLKMKNSLFRILIMRFYYIDLTKFNNLVLYHITYKLISHLESYKRMIWCYVGHYRCKLLLFFTTFNQFMCIFLIHTDNIIKFRLIAWYYILKFFISLGQCTRFIKTTYIDNTAINYLMIRYTINLLLFQSSKCIIYANHHWFDNTYRVRHDPKIKKTT